MKISIDGPSGSGKSTVGSLLAKKMSYFFLSTGKLYRSIAWKVLEEDVDPSDHKKAVEVAEKINLKVEPFDGGFRFFVDGTDVTEKLASESVGMATSIVSAYKEVREKLNDIQKEIGGKEKSILEGRDIGSVIMPKADIKFFLTASSVERGNRRYEELKSAGDDVSRQEVIEAVRKRDANDMNRLISPLVRPDGAIDIDSSGLSVEEVVELMVVEIKKKETGL